MKTFDITDMIDRSRKFVINNNFLCVWIFDPDRLTNDFDVYVLDNQQYYKNMSMENNYNHGYVFLKLLKIEN
jgi:hypothetical protein